MEQQYKPKEWFEISPDRLAALVGAFNSEKPKSLGEIPEKDLSVFFMGLLSAIDWHAKRANEKYVSQVDQELIEEEKRFYESLEQKVQSTIKERDHKVLELQEQLGQANQIINNKTQILQQAISENNVLRTNEQEILSDNRDLQQRVSQANRRAKFDSQVPLLLMLALFAIGVILISLMVIDNLGLASLPMLLSS